jgi:hypothetical protein
MVRRDGADSPSASGADDRKWRELGIPEPILPDAIAAFGTSELAARWVRALNEADPPTVTYWQSSGYLSQLRESGLSPEEFEQWVKKGISVYQVFHLCRFISADEAVRMLRNWAPPSLHWQEMLAGAELIELLKNGFDLERLRSLAQTGLTGHDVYRWRKSHLPSRDWITWHNLGIGPDQARQFYYEAGVRDPRQALEWMNTGLSIDSIREYVSSGWSPQQVFDDPQSESDPDVLDPSLPGLGDDIQYSTMIWTDFFARPRSSAPAFAVHSELPEQFAERLRYSLRDLQSYGVVSSSMFDHTFRGLAFLDGGWAMRSPYGLNGPPRQWIVGSRAMALLCHRLRVDLPRRGRFRKVPPRSGT